MRGQSYHERAEARNWNTPDPPHPEVLDRESDRASKDAQALPQDSPEKETFPP
jgi:hypothetical protein